MSTKIYARPGRKDRRSNRLGLLAQMYFDVERLRVAQDIRQTHLRLDGSPFADDSIFEEVSAHLLEAQKVIDKQMKPLVLDHPCWTEFGLHVKGVGPHLLALIMGLVRDITPFTNVSKLWWLCGLAVVDGKAQRPVKGQVTNYDARLKSVLLGRLATQLLMNGDPFARKLYDRFKARELARGVIIEMECSRCKGTGKLDVDGANERDCGKCKGAGTLRVSGAHRLAIRKVVKLWVACLWDVWRRAEGLEVSQHYEMVHAAVEQVHTSTQVEERQKPVTPQEWVEYNLKA